jgi:hypothetical protein
MHQPGRYGRPHCNYRGGPRMTSIAYDARLRLDAAGLGDVRCVFSQCWRFAPWLAVAVS